MKTSAEVGPNQILSHSIAQVFKRAATFFARIGIRLELVYLMTGEAKLVFADENLQASYLVRDVTPRGISDLIPLAARDFLSNDFVYQEVACPGF